LTKSTDTPGLRFRIARTRAGLSQTQAAAKAGTSQAAISQFEAGVREVRLDRLRAWCVACEIDPHEVDGQLSSTRV
jgi:transcriptional regulator with XRE-family HTH domain